MPNDNNLLAGALLIGGGGTTYAAARHYAGHRDNGSPSAQCSCQVPPRIAATTGATTEGPITSPSQVDGDRRQPIDPYPIDTRAPIDPYAQPLSPPAHLGLPRLFDPIFETYRAGIPIAYLRALAMRESGMNPRERSGPAWGLMQITEVVRHEYNRLTRTAYAREHLLDPAVNIAIGCWLLRQIIASYKRHHPNTPSLHTNWTNQTFIELLTCGWNAGFSEQAGVGRVARYLEQRSINVTIDTVHRHASAAGGIRHLSEPARFRWWRSVAELYGRELRSMSTHRGASWLGIKTPSVILDEMRSAKSEVESLGRDIYATFRHPYEAQLAAAEAKFQATYGRKPGVGREAQSDDYTIVRSWMQPVPTDDDWANVSYAGVFVFQWGEFEREFLTFYAEHAGSWTERLWRINYDKAVEFRERALNWRAVFVALGGKPTTPEPTPPDETILPTDFKIPWKALAVVGGVTAGLLVAPTVINSVKSK